MLALLIKFIAKFCQFVKYGVFIAIAGSIYSGLF